ncbi:hypothetical protein PG987_014275 [Apiospora arundinis]
MPADNGTQPHHLVSPPLHHRDKPEPDSDDGNGLHSGDDIDADDDQYEAESARSGKRKRPLSVSCELCKQRKVKCDRGQPSCGWCKRNSVYCEYRERKKPGLRAGYGRELEQRLRQAGGDTAVTFGDFAEFVYPQPASWCTAERAQCPEQQRERTQ